MPVNKKSLKGRILLNFKRGFGFLHQAAYRWSGGRVGNKVMGAPVLLLTTKGCKTGRSRTVPLVYFEQDGCIVLSASNAGHWEPAWFRNVCRHPHVGVQLGSRRFEATARIADGKERDDLWARMESLNKAFARYPVNRECAIPMVVLTPTTS